MGQGRSPRQADNVRHCIDTWDRTLPPSPSATGDQLSREYCSDQLAARPPHFPKKARYGVSPEHSWISTLLYVSFGAFLKTARTDRNWRTAFLRTLQRPAGCPPHGPKAARVWGPPESLNFYIGVRKLWRIFADRNIDATRSDHNWRTAFSWTLQRPTQRKRGLGYPQKGLHSWVRQTSTPPPIEIHRIWSNCKTPLKTSRGCSSPSSPPHPP